MKVRNTFIIFIVSGFWHGANWTFIVWGALNAIYFLPLLLLKRNRQNLGVVAEGKYLPSIREFFNMSTTFALTLLAWVFFRSDNVGHAFRYLNEIFSYSLFTMPQFEVKNDFMIFNFVIFFFVLIEWFGREDQFAIEKLGTKWRKPFRWIFYYAIIMVLFYLRGKPQEFIYFQF